VTSLVEVGVDIIEIDRIEKAVQRRRFLERIYTEAEIAYSQSKAKPSQHLAGFFAAKEAVIKCLGRMVPWHDIEVCHNDAGKPFVILRRRALELARGGRVSISISHCRSCAVAVAVLETTAGRENTSTQIESNGATDAGVGEIGELI
jgi:holo-[acyl-carrier protein] synthase